MKKYVFDLDNSYSLIKAIKLAYAKRDDKFGELACHKTNMCFLPPEKKDNHFVYYKNIKKK
jgi:hypothetical protein